ncbi:PadR family transcriptional regulator [Psychromonas ossibalaenae]|uniref:PadR family transcriptional regulator n=1 Tax=Psychromonas ossibalaenae TaxID=444922 RepID=UPI00037778E0|nr:PadR family transcriptional regulator [Psychromonas ossibalaenae]
MANKQMYLGEFEHVVLLSIMHLDNNAYGVTIRHQLKEMINRDVTLGALYSTIERLEKKGYITSKKGGSKPERGGKAKRLVQVTTLGLNMLSMSKKQFETMWQNIPTLENTHA